MYFVGEVRLRLSNNSNGVCGATRRVAVALSGGYLSECEFFGDVGSSGSRTIY